MNYNQTINYIHSVSNFFCKPGLERIKLLCEKLNNPQNKLRFIHVAGTNGKGSFCAMLSSVLTQSGYKTGLYTSPYILNFNERIQIDGQQIPNAQLAKITQKVKRVAQQMDDKPTEFEVITAIAFEYFAIQKCDIVVLECGMGGRFDATNIIPSPVLSVITSVSLDHTAFLGDTLEKIAYEKAGIIKGGTDCLLCNKKDEYFNVIKNECDIIGCKLHIVDKSQLNLVSFSLEKTVFDFGELKSVEISLLGRYQPENAANVISALNILKNKGFPVSEQAIKEGLKNTKWPARFEIINRNPLIIFDGSHNEEGVIAAVESIKEYIKGEKINIITGVMKDKDYHFIARKIGEIAKAVYCVTPDNPRALKSSDYAEVFSQINAEAINCDSVSLAVDRILKLHTPTVILGSLYMYKEVIDYLKDR